MCKLSVVLCLVIILGSCRKEAKLVYPINGDEVLPCCTDFLWKGKKNVTYRLQIFTGSSWNNSMIDTLVTENSFLLNQSLKPGQEIYWQVDGDNTTGKNTATFRVKDVVSKFEGNCIGYVKYRKWKLGTPDSLSEYIDTIHLSEIFTDLNVTFSVSPVGFRASFAPYDGGNPFNSSESVCYSKGFGSSQSHAYLNYVNDSIFIYESFGGLGSGEVWKFYGKR